jgi:hypothetical protein
MGWFLIDGGLSSAFCKDIPLSRRLPFFAFPISLMATVSMACSIALGGPEVPTPGVLLGANPADITQAWAHAYSERQNDQWVVIFTEAQLTAYFQSRLDADPSFPLSQPSVLLRDGSISVFGQYKTEYVSASVLVELQPAIHEDGTVEWKVVDGQFGPSHIPAGMLSAISGMIHQALTSPTGVIATGFQVKEVLIGNGQIAIRCQSTP